MNEFTVGQMLPTVEPDKEILSKEELTEEQKNARSEVERMIQALFNK